MESLGQSARLFQLLEAQPKYFVGKFPGLPGESPPARAPRRPRGGPAAAGGGLLQLRPAPSGRATRQLPGSSFPMIPGEKNGPGVRDVSGNGSRRGSGGPIPTFEQRESVQDPTLADHSRKHPSLPK